MSGLAEALGAFREITGCRVKVLAEHKSGAALSVVAAAPPEWGKTAFDPRTDALPDGCRVAEFAGPGRAWIVLGECWNADDAARHLRLLVPIVSQQLQASLEVEHAATELAERYEEINLLYTTSEILGRTVNMQEAAATILKEISETVGARKAAILVHDRVTDTLNVAAMLGAPATSANPIAVSDKSSVSAEVFRSQRARIIEADEPTGEAEAAYRRGTMLSVPIMWTGTQGAEPLGVVNLSDRRSTQAFTAGDQKLITAIATQIATAIQNARLVRTSLAQQQLVQEMQLAHDLQMKLLPDVRSVAPEAMVAARVVPAESVGGDFYHLFRLTDGRIGVMIGDVSSHGYRAALIMTLAMSAAAIHAQATVDPGELVNRLRASLHDELESTEMSISVFYAVVNAAAGEIRYANSGHPHAFIVRNDGRVERLPAAHPPLGMYDENSPTGTRRWQRDDRLLLFTDGVSDARDARGARLGEEAVLSLVKQERAGDPGEILDKVFAVINRHVVQAPLRDDLTLVVLRT